MILKEMTPILIIYISVYGKASSFLIFDVVIQSISKIKKSYKTISHKLRDLTN